MWNIDQILNTEKTLLTSRVSSGVFIVSGLGKQWWCYNNIALYFVFIVGCVTKTVIQTPHYNDVIMSQEGSQITNSLLFTQSFIQTQIKENIKALRHWPLCGEFTGDGWIPHTKGQ